MVIENRQDYNKKYYKERRSVILKRAKDKTKLIECDICGKFYNGDQYGHHEKSKQHKEFNNFLNTFPFASLIFEDENENTDEEFINFINQLIVCCDV
jgi:hypothetical protein